MKNKIMKAMYWIFKEIVTNATLLYLGVLLQAVLYEGTDWFPSFVNNWIVAIAIVAMRYTYIVNSVWVDKIKNK